MENNREVKKSYCIMSVAYIVVGTFLLLWPDISVHTFCFVFGVGMIILGGAHLIMYFTKDRLLTIMQPDLVIGVICTATGCYLLLKMEYMLEIIPFAMGVVALLGGIVKIQSALDLKRLGAGKWFIMLIWAFLLLGAGVVLIIDPFDEQHNIVVILIGVSLLLDGIGNLVSIFWIGIIFKKLKRVSPETLAVTVQDKKEEDIIDADTVPVEEEEKKSKIVGKHVFFRKKSEKHGEENTGTDSLHEQINDVDELNSKETDILEKNEQEVAEDIANAAESEGEKESEKEK